MSFDVDSASFDAEQYVSRLLKECNLKQIMEKECEVNRESQCLHSEMQTLVYENYNKFILATDTVKKMRCDFEGMRAEMDRLDENISKITSFSDAISSSLEEGRSRVERLCETSHLLARLHFLFLLPKRMNDAIARGRHADAVRDYERARHVLRRYGDQPSFEAIKRECDEIVDRLVDSLKHTLSSGESTATQLAESVRLLVSLRGPESDLHLKFLASSEPRLLEHLDTLSDSVERCDLLEWVERGNSGLLTDLGIVIASYSETFADSHDDDVNAKLDEFTDTIVRKYLELARDKFESYASKTGTEVLARGLDKFYRRLQAMNRRDYAAVALDAVAEAISNKAKNHRANIRAHFWERLVTVRQTIAAAKTAAGNDLKELLSSLHVFFMEKIQASLQDLTMFLQPGLCFGLKPSCTSGVVTACSDLVSRTVLDLVDVVEGFCVLQAVNNNTPVQLLLILSRLCYELQSSGVHCLLNQAENLIDKANHSGGAAARLNENLKESLSKAVGDGAQKLLDGYVNCVGLKVSQMLRVSVLSREWVRVPEPRGVRAVARRVLEALAAAEQDALQLYESGAATRQSSDSSRRTHSLSASKLPYRSNWSSGLVDSNLASNINKLFSEKIEIFTSVEPTKVSIMTGIVKISLKTFLECVRLRTYSRYGLQQMQVDIHYLQLYLWQYVQDENLVHILLDEVLGSVINRCIDPRLMEPSVVDIICERG